AEIFRISQRNDEFRLWPRRHHLALRLWLSDRSHRKLDAAIRRFDLPFAARRGPSLPDAPRPTVRKGHDATGDRAGGHVIIALGRVYPSVAHSTRRAKHFCLPEIMPDVQPFAQKYSSFRKSEDVL